MNMLHTFSLRTGQHDTMINITNQVESLVQQSHIHEGIALVYCQHTTAGIMINENADPDVKYDLLRRLNEMMPWKHPQDRHAEGNTAAHLKAIYVGNSQTIPIHNGKLLLGQWQGIYFCEFDGPRERHCVVKIIPG
jgi:secondary thiamine-phosphate synthase enzyme